MPITALEVSGARTADGVEATTASADVAAIAQESQHRRGRRLLRRVAGLLALLALVIGSTGVAAAPRADASSWFLEPRMNCWFPHTSVSVDVGMRTTGVYQVWLYDWQAGKYVDVKEGYTLSSSGPGGNHGIVSFSNVHKNRWYSAYIIRWHIVNGQWVVYDRGWVQVQNNVWQPTVSTSCWNG